MLVDVWGSHTGEEYRAIGLTIALKLFSLVLTGQLYQLRCRKPMTLICLVATCCICMFQETVWSNTTIYKMFKLPL